MKKRYILTSLLTLALSVSAAGMASAAEAAPVLAHTANASGTQQTLRLEGLPDDCYGVELTLSMDRDRHYTFDFDRALSADGNYPVFRADGGTITLYIAAGETPLDTGVSLALGTLSADSAFSIDAVSGLKLVNGSMQKETLSAAALRAGSASGGSGDSARYAVEVHEDIPNGSLTVSPASAGKGTKVTVTAVADAGCSLVSLSVSDKDGKELTLTKQGKNQYTFTMPASDVLVDAVFRADGGEASALPATIPFSDVPTHEWYYGAVRYVYGNGMMSGTEPTLFSPNVTTTRGMIVTILYRLEGRPEAPASAFRDVPAGQYYADAVSWASANGIVSGYGDGFFGPEDTVSREQMAAILYRYARYCGYGTDAAADLSGYADAWKISPYAETALQWANANNLITGTTPTTLTPDGSATRAQVASILMRFCENVAQ